jgi:light-harvesting protein B-800-850 beta chain
LQMSTWRDTLSLDASWCPAGGGVSLVSVASRGAGWEKRNERREGLMSDDPDKVWPTGLTLKEAEEVHSYIIDGTRVFGAIALLAHVLVAVSTPWLG